jgi:hypothetical protein
MCYIRKIEICHFAFSGSAIRVRMGNDAFIAKIAGWERTAPRR